LLPNIVEKLAKILPDATSIFLAAQSDIGCNATSSWMKHTLWIIRKRRKTHGVGEVCTEVLRLLRHHKWRHAPYRNTHSGSHDCHLFKFRPRVVRFVHTLLRIPSNAVGVAVADTPLVDPALRKTSRQTRSISHRNQGLRLLSFYDPNDLVSCHSYMDALLESASCPPAYWPAFSFFPTLALTQ
jgi:hypothetical protein